MPPPNRPRRAVTALERGFPFEHLSEIARQESYRKEIHRPLYHVHKWWATRLGSVFRAMVLGANLPAEADLLREFYRPQSFDDCIVLDPFMGSGTTVGEALKLGCRVVGADINPISSFQVQTVLQACSQVDLSAAFQRLERRVAPTIRSWYQSSYQGEPAEVLYAFWVKQVPCPDCGAQTRLFDRWVFASHAYPSFHLLMPLFICRVWEGEPMPREGQEIRWLRPKELFSLPMPEADRPLLPFLDDLL